MVGRLSGVTVTLVLLGTILVAGCRDESELPNSPATVTMGSSLFGNGYYITITNTNDKYMTYLLICRNPTTGNSERFQIELGPGGTQNMGAYEGWKFSSGDTIEIRNDAYKTVHLSIP